MLAACLTPELPQSLANRQWLLLLTQYMQVPVSLILLRPAPIDEQRSTAGTVGPWLPKFLGPTSPLVAP